MCLLPLRSTDPGYADMFFHKQYYYDHTKFHVCIYVCITVFSYSEYERPKRFAIFWNAYIFY